MHTDYLPYLCFKDINQTFLKKTLIFGDVDKVYKDDVYNAILLNIKYYIYQLVFSGISMEREFT
jgi:hypothetical protein